MAPPTLDHRTAMLFIARAKKKMRAEREAAIEELRAWFRAQIEELRAEMAVDRAELRAARVELERKDGGADVVPQLH